VGTADYAAVSGITSSSGLLTINGHVELGRIHPNPSQNRLAWAVSYQSIRVAHYSGTRLFLNIIFNADSYSNYWDLNAQFEFMHERAEQIAI